MKLFYPVDEGMFTISQLFGVNPQWYPDSLGHPGIDWAMPVGNNIYAMEDGEIIRADDLQKKVGYGRHVRIKHTEGTSIYGHLSKLNVKVGDKVLAKQIIGLSGGATSDPASGNSTGPHLHGEYRLYSGWPVVAGSYGGGAIDILPLLVSHDYMPGIEEKPLYSLQVLITNLVVHSGAGRSYSGIRNSGLGIFPIYAEQNGYGRISKLLSEWISLDPQYSVKVEGTPDPVKTWENMTIDEKLELLKTFHSDIV
jgi:murein DD-endopeptidase MepM/ murein hydrolase activator NlpD